MIVDDCPSKELLQKEHLEVLSQDVVSQECPAIADVGELESCKQRSSCVIQHGGLSSWAARIGDYQNMMYQVHMCDVCEFLGRLKHWRFGVLWSMNGRCLRSALIDRRPQPLAHETLGQWSMISRVSVYLHHRYMRDAACRYHKIIRETDVSVQLVTGNRVIANTLSPLYCQDGDREDKAALKV